MTGICVKFPATGSRGSVMGSHLDGEETVCVVTYQAKEELVRVYRLS